MCTEYSETLDFFGYMILSAPDFPIEDGMTLTSAFESLLHGVDAVASKMTNPNAREKLARCREEVNRSISLFATQDISMALMHLQHAREMFRRSKAL